MKASLTISLAIIPSCLPASHIKLKDSKSGEHPEIPIQAKTIKGHEVVKVLPEDKVFKFFYLIEVSDNGIGFKQQYAEQIFSMFQRLHGKGEYPGTGIGLSIAHRVVKNHHGYIWTISKYGEGATFKLLLSVE